MTTIYHFDKEQRLRPGQVIEIRAHHFSPLGRKVANYFQHYRLPKPSSTSPVVPDERLTQLHPLVLREYLLESARVKLGASVCRLNCMFASEDLESAQRTARRLQLKEGLPIYRAEVNGTTNRHDMTWLDHDFGGPPYSQRSAHYLHYWKGSLMDNDPMFARPSNPSIAELLVQGQVTIIERAGSTI